MGLQSLFKDGELTPSNILRLLLVVNNQLVLLCTHVCIARGHCTWTRTCIDETMIHDTNIKTKKHANTNSSSHAMRKERTWWLVSTWYDKVTLRNTSCSSFSWSMSASSWFYVGPEETSDVYNLFHKYIDMQFLREIILNTQASLIQSSLCLEGERVRSGAERVPEPKDVSWRRIMY